MPAATGAAGARRGDVLPGATVDVDDARRDRCTDRSRRALQVPHEPAARRCAVPGPRAHGAGRDAEGTVRRFDERRRGDHARDRDPRRRARAVRRGRSRLGGADGRRGSRRSPRPTPPRSRPPISSRSATGDRGGAAAPPMRRRTRTARDSSRARVGGMAAEVEVEIPGPGAGSGPRRESTSAGRECHERAAARSRPPCRGTRSSCRTSATARTTGSRRRTGTPPRGRASRGRAGRPRRTRARRCRRRRDSRRTRRSSARRSAGASPSTRRRRPSGRRS